MFSSLPACVQLHLAYNNLSIIPKGAFTSLSSLTKIYLNGNNIQTIPANVFPNNLVQIFLGSNKISALKDIANINFIKYLHLINNSISTIPANVFSTLSNCVDLSLNRNPIENIEVGALNGLDRVTSLDLHATSLTHLSQNMFEGLPSLQTLQLQRSRISTIERGALKGLDFLQTLNLSQNKLTVIDSYMFSGLFSLKALFLLNNNINDIKDFAFLTLRNLTHLYLYKNELEYLRLNTFAGLGSLEVLDLGDNKLTTLDPLVLSPLPRPFGLTIDARLTPSSLVCDMRLCWLKLEEEVGGIVFNFKRSYYGGSEGVYYPTCTAGVDWQRFQCLATLPCRDPGDMEFAERSGSFLPFNNNSQPGLGLPYSTDSELRYTCDLCFTGGGTISCQSNGQWTSKPECVRLDNKVVCRAPVLVDGYLTPSYDQYECGVKVTFTCNQGSTQTVGVCGPDGEFIGGVSSCVENESPDRDTETTTGSPTTNSPITDSPITDSPNLGTKPESGATEGGSSGLIYGIVGGVVGGIVLMALVGLTIFCFIRSKKSKPSDGETVKTPNTAAGDVASEAGYTGLVTVDTKGKPGNSLNRQTESSAERGTPEQRVTGDSTVYSNTAYEDEYQEIEDALPKDDPYADVDEDADEN